MSDSKRDEAFVREAFHRWRPRYLNAGLDVNDIELLADSIDHWSDWCNAFIEMGETHAELGEGAEKRDDLESAGQHYVQAGLYAHFGSHVWHVDEQRRETAHRTSVRWFESGGQYLRPPVQRLDVPYSPGGFEIACHLRLSPYRDDSPLIVLLPGLESTKEELYTYQSHLLERGLSTLAIDGAGQGETWYHKRMSTEYPALVSEVLDYVQAEDFDGLDINTIGILGQSLGGFYAPFVATSDRRISACVSISGPFTVGPVSSWSSELSKEHFAHAAKTESLVELDDLTERLTLRDRLDDLEAPVLAITGGRDTTVAPAQTERIARQAPRGEFVCYEDANHICNNVPYKCRPYVSDWLRSQLGSASKLSE